MSVTQAGLHGHMTPAESSSQPLRVPSLERAKWDRAAVGVQPQGPLWTRPWFAPGLFSLQPRGRWSRPAAGRRFSSYMQAYFNTGIICLGPGSTLEEGAGNETHIFPSPLTHSLTDSCNKIRTIMKLLGRCCLHQL